MASSNVVKSQVLKVADLALTSNPIMDTHFEDCIMQGPAVITFIGETGIFSSGFEGELKDVLWEVHAGRSTIVGAVGFANCVFTRCQFRNIGVAGDKEFMESFAGLMSGGKES